MLVVKLIGTAVLVGLVLLGATVWDLGWNGGRMMFHLTGGARIEADCTKPLQDDLVGKGYVPVDLTFGTAPSFSLVSGSFGRAKSLSNSFTFSDGENGPRIDGELVCRIGGRSVDVQVRVDQLPRRVT